MCSDALSDDAARNYIVRNFSNGSLQVQAQQALLGGTDLNCGGLYGEQNAGAVRSGLVKQSELDQALIRVWTKAIQAGVLDLSSGPFGRLGAEAVDTPSTRALALEAALQSIVLLKNEQATLPLSTNKLQSVAIIGPHGNSSDVLLGGPNYRGQQHPIACRCLSLYR